MRIPVSAIGFACGATATAGVLVLAALEPASIWGPFAVVAAACLVLAATAAVVDLLGDALKARKERRRAAAVDAARLREQRSQAWLDALARRPDRVNQLIADARRYTRDQQWLRRGEGER
ncbi:hypothetical protein [Streptosporangium sandarakinum]